MSWVRSDLVECYWGRNTVGLCRGGDDVTWQAVTDRKSAMDVVRVYLKERGGWRRSIRVWLSAAHAKPFMVPATSGARDRAEATVLAKAMATEFTGLTGDVAIWLDQWRPPADCTAVAMDAGLLGEIGASCKEIGWRCVSVRPWWCLPLAEVEALGGNPNGSVCWSVSEPDGMTMGTLEAGIVNSMDWVGVLDHDPSWAHTVRRAAVGAGAKAVQWHARAVLTEANLGSKKEVESGQLPAIGFWSRFDLA